MITPHVYHSETCPPLYNQGVSVLRTLSQHYPQKPLYNITPASIGSHDRRLNPEPLVSPIKKELAQSHLQSKICSPV